MREYFYTITIQWVATADGRMATVTRNGTIDVTGTVSRRKVIDDIIREAREFNNVQGDHVVLFLSIEPNELAA